MFQTEEFKKLTKKEKLKILFISAKKVQSERLKIEKWILKKLKYEFIDWWGCQELSYQAKRLPKLEKLLKYINMQYERYSDGFYLTTSRNGVRPKYAKYKDDGAIIKLPDRQELH